MELTTGSINSRSRPSGHLSGVSGFFFCVTVQLETDLQRRQLGSFQTCSVMKQKNPPASGTKTE